MRLSRISRGLIVAIFVLIIVFLGVLDIKLIFKGELEDIYKYSPFEKLIYAIIIFILTIIYVYIKDKFYKMKIKRKIALVYRYMYLISITIIARYIIIINTIKDLSSFAMVFNIVFTIITSIIVKKIVFNISKSDILSVIAVVAYSMNLNVIINKEILYTSIFITFIVTLIILVLQLLIDELKQKGIKTKKYVILSCLLGILMGISSLIGVNIMDWVIVLVSLVFITVNLDNTHIDFPKNFVNALSNKYKDKLYKIERVNINKILISILISVICIIVIYNIGQLILYKFTNIDILRIFNNIEINSNIPNSRNTINDFIIYSEAFLGLSSTYYLSIIAYILILELLSFFLRRRYDTKTTVIKLIFILLFITVYILKLNILYFQPLFNILLVIISIINTSSMYLNREERIKMLVA